jgi:asparagine synthase (glutamine-hydrolysing)
MCGIAGIFQPERPLNHAERAWLPRAMNLLRHRGPDGQGGISLMNGRCQLGHLRLAIIDLEHGGQPIANEDGTVWVICNGEIYNYVELRARLLASGHTFSTASDTEVLVHLYEEKETLLLDELEGMYAFALIDTRKERLFLARDRFGEKPLYWASLDGRGVAFASELKALSPLPGVTRDLDIPALAQFLGEGYIPAPRTHLLGIRKLCAGEALVQTAHEQPRIFRYWQPEFKVESPRQWNMRQACEVFQSTFQRALQIRLRSDVPVAAFLSGGIDSTLVATTVRQLRPGVTLKTFCVGFEDETLDEAPYAKQIAERIGSEHSEIYFSSTELQKLFDDLIAHYDEPFADASMFPTFAVCRAAGQSCKVALSGEGGDECFGGYRPIFSYYRWHRLRRFSGTNRGAEWLLRKWHPNWRGRGLLSFLRKSDFNLLAASAASAKPLSWFQPELRAAASQGLQELDGVLSHHARLPYPLSAMERDANSYLPEQLLVKIDRASMFNALECRTPFLDRNLFAFASSLPLHYHFTRGQGKALLRRSLPAWVPSNIRWRSKQGFTPPLCKWFRTILRPQIDDAIGQLSRVGILNVAELAELNRQHQAGVDRSPELFRWLVLSRALAACN